MNGAPSAAGATSKDNYDSRQAVTIQQFSLRQPGYGQTQQDTVQELTEAMSNLLKATSGKGVEHAYVGAVHPDIAEQIFLWKSPPDASMLDTIQKSFASFSSSGTVVKSFTSAFSEKNTLLRSLEYPIIETGIADILPNVSRAKVEHDESVVIESILRTGLGLGGSRGIQQVQGRRTFMLINGWESQQAVAQWADDMKKDPEVAPVYDELVRSFEKGTAVLLFKSMRKVP